MTLTADPPAPVLLPLAQTDMLTQYPNAPVLIVHADPAVFPEDWFPEHIWILPPISAEHTDLSALQGREVVIWPGNTKTAKAEAAYIKAHVTPKPRVLKAPRGADTDWSPLVTRTEDWSTARFEEYLAVNGLRTAAPDAPPHLDAGPDYDPASDAPEGSDAPFQCLGYDHGENFYRSRAGKQVVKIGSSHHTAGALLQLAPLQHWELNYPAKSGANWTAAANALLRMSERVGVYDSGRIRGRGAWHDDGRVVLHLGDRLIVDGAPIALEDFQTDYIYEAAPIMRFGRGEPLRASEAVKLHDICKALNWERPESGTLLAGWLVIAPICGALNWRPHLYLTGETGAGKSWVFQKVVVPVLGDVALALAGKTTEPSIRRGLGSDARPVLLDEFESRDSRISNDTQSVLDLCRYMSSETSATIGKGNSSGGVDYFRPRACVMVYSTGVALKEQADKNRFAICTLLPDKSPDKAEKFETLEKMQTTLTPDYVAALQARTLANIPVIRPNTVVFARAASKVFGTQRMGDQVGALLAGAYSLHSSGLVTDDTAMAWILSQQWTEEKDVLAEKDGDAVIAHLCEHQIFTETAHGPKQRAIGELARIAAGQSFTDELVSRDAAFETLRRHGMLVKCHEGQWWMLIGNRHSGVARILKDTPWGTAWNRRIKTSDNAIVWPVPVKFTHGPTTERCTAIRLDAE